MKNRILKTVSLVALFLSALVIYSCTKEITENQNDLSSNNKALALLEKKNNIIKVENSTTLNILSTVVNPNNENSFYQTKNKNEYFVISKIGNKFTLTKGILDNNQFIEEKKFELLDNMDSKGNGNYKIKNINEGVEISQVFKDGIFLNTIVVSDHNNMNIKGFCQRENGETFSQCNSRETSEFCDDFVSTVAYITNPSVPILIAATCSC